MGRYTIRQTSSVSLLLTTFISQCSHLFCFRNSQECQFSSWGSPSRSWQRVQHFNACMANFSTTWTPGLTPSRFAFRHCYFPKYPLDPVAMLQTFSVPFALSCLRNSIVFLPTLVRMFRPPFVLSNKCSVANNPRLPKRAPFSFVGDLANSLFDVATVSDVKKLKQHVDKLYFMQLSMTAGAIATTGKLSSFMKTSNERMNNLMETIATAHSNILNITKTIYRQDLRNYAIQRSVLSLVPVLLTKLEQVVRLERTLDTFLLGVNMMRYCNANFPPS